MIKAVIFDLDGTVIDATEAIVASFLHTFAVIGERPPPRAEIVKSIGYVIEEQFRLFTAHDPNECARIYRAHNLGVACRQTRLMPGAKESLMRLQAHDVLLGFATSKGRDRAEMTLAHLCVLDMFSARVGSGDVTRPKPHPEAVFKALEGLDSTPEETFVVGDTPLDVLAARAACVRCLCVTTGYATEQELRASRPEAVFGSLEEVARYVLSHCVSPHVR
jgi:phosphoglycolate phosphatase